MSMYCFQCQETLNNQGCVKVGVCGKTSEVANLQDLLIYLCKGIAFYGQLAIDHEISVKEDAFFIAHSLFTTITNANFDEAYFVQRIQEAIVVRDSLRNRLKEFGIKLPDTLPDAAVWQSAEAKAMDEKAETVGVLRTQNEDVRSLRELIVYGVKGIAAYAEHAHSLGRDDHEVLNFFMKSLAATLDDMRSIDELVALSMETGTVAVKAMALLDGANTATYGHPQPTRVSIGVRNRPGILVTGHDLHDLEDLLVQTQGEGIDIYTHGEMLPAHGYPELHKYEHLVGNYGGAWHEQLSDFEAFQGPILLTTNCLIPPKATYRDRVYTTGAVGFPGLTHIADREQGKRKDFKVLIEHAKRSASPKEIETGYVQTGFAHNAVLSIADTVISAVKQGAIRKFVVMAGCDGRQQSRGYFTELAQKLPHDTVILTAGCAKYRYNKLDLGEIVGIPRVLDAGQCNDSYSLVVIAQALAQAFELDDINQLPLAFDIGWYEQKAVAVLLALLSLGVKGIRLGPTLPAFVSANVLDILVKNFAIDGTTTVDADLEAMMAV